MNKIVFATFVLLISNVSLADATKGSCRDGQIWKTVTTKVIPNTTPTAVIRAQLEVDSYKMASTLVSQLPPFTPQAPYVLECSDPRITEVNGNLELVLDYSNMSGPLGLVFRAYNCGRTIWVFSGLTWAWSDGQGHYGTGVVDQNPIWAGGISTPETWVSRHCAYMGEYND